MADSAEPDAVGGRKSAKNFPAEPQENILYFVEKFSPKLEEWEREIVRIVRKLSQYFYPQAPDEGDERGLGDVLALHDLNRLHEQGQVDDGFMFEFLKSHTNVVYSRRSTRSTTRASIRMRSASRCSPTSGAYARADAEDRTWFPDLAGSDWQRALDFAMRNFKDESFIAQYLSPRLIRELRLFAVADHRSEITLKVDSIHDDQVIAACASSSRSSTRRKSACPTSRS